MIRHVVPAVFLVMSVSGAHLVSAQQLSADPTGAARTAAQKDLLELPSHYRPLGAEDASVFKRASLGTPITWYWPDSTFLDYESAPPEDLLEYVRRIEIRFPVVVDGSVLGTINVIPDGRGEYRVVSRSHGGRGVGRWEAIERELSIPSGQRLSILGTSIAGSFFIVEDGQKIYRMASIGAQQTSGAPVEFLPVENFAGSIKERLGAYKRQLQQPGRALDAQTFGEH